MTEFRTALCDQKLENDDFNMSKQQISKNIRGISANLRTKSNNVKF